MKKPRASKSTVNRTTEMPEVTVRITQGGGTPAQLRSWQLLWDRLLSPAPADQKASTSGEGLDNHGEVGHA